MRRGIVWFQGMLIFLAIVLVVVFFASGLLSPGKQQEREKPTGESSIQPAPAVGDQKPGVPAIPVSDHETWPHEPVENPDRQLDVKSTNPTVQLPAALGDDLTPYWQQSLSWQPCGVALCATMKVPMDWDNPGKAALDIKITKVPSAEPTKGPLFVNPGGPGVEAGSFATDLGRDRWKGYDIVAWDPRGSGESTHVQCGTTEQTDAAYSADSTPDDEAEKAALNDSWAAFARECREASGELLDHLTTIENVRDLDLLRFLMGAEKLNYVGVSYGTFIGSMYAELFPEHAGRLVLDSAVDITNEGEVFQAEGFETALGLYADWCAGKESCSLGNSRDEVTSRINSFLHGLDANPLKVGDRQVTQGQGAIGIALYLYSGEEAYPLLTRTIEAAMNGKGKTLLEANDGLTGRRANGWETSAYAFPAIRCVDHPDAGVAATDDIRKKMAEKAPVFGSNMGVELVCERWTANSAPNLKLTGKGAAPILVVGSTGDSATPYQQAVSMAKQLESGHLLTYDGPGHGAVSAGNACVDATITAYLQEGTLPEDGKTCS